MNSFIKLNFEVLIINRKNTFQGVAWNSEMIAKRKKQQTCEGQSRDAEVVE